MTEMLKGTLEGIVLAVLATQPAYGYEITARLREQGFSDLVEGTVLPVTVADSNTVAGSLVRSPDRSDTNNAATDWVFTTTVTPGTANVVTTS